MKSASTIKAMSSIRMIGILILIGGSIFGLLSENEPWTTISGFLVGMGFGLVVVSQVIIFINKNKNHE